MTGLAASTRTSDGGGETLGGVGGDGVKENVAEGWGHLAYVAGREGEIGATEREGVLRRVEGARGGW